MKVYSVSYNAGTAGAWLTQFINLHSGFQNYNDIEDLTWNYTESDWQTTVVDKQWNDKSNVTYCLNPTHNICDIDRADTLLTASNTIGIIVPYVNEELKQEFVKHNSDRLDVSVERSVLNLDYGRIACTSSDDNVNEYSRFNRTHKLLAIDMGRLLNCNSNEYHQLTKFLHVGEHSDYEQLCAEYKANVFPS